MLFSVQLEGVYFMGRPKKNVCESVKSSLTLPADLHKSLLRMARHKGLSLNDFLGKILSDYIKKNAQILKILDETDKRIAEIENKGGDDVAED